MATILNTLSKLAYPIIALMAVMDMPVNGKSFKENFNTIKRNEFNEE